LTKKLYADFRLSSKYLSDLSYEISILEPLMMYKVACSPVLITKATSDYESIVSIKILYINLY